MKLTKKIGCWLILILLFNLNLVFAASSPLDIKNLYFEVISTKDNLPNSVIRQIEQDSLGFLWFGSNDGLFRYDGQNYRIYRNISDKPTSLSFNYLNDMHIDRNGDPWIMTYKSLDHLDLRSGKFTHYYPASSTTNNLDLSSSYQFVVTPQNHIYLTSTDHGLMYFANNDSSIHILTEEVTTPKELSSNLEAIAYHNHCLYIGKKYEGIYEVKLDQSDSEIADIRQIVNSNHAETFTIKIEPNGRLWAGTSDGLIRYDLIRKTTTHYYYAPSTNFFLPDKEIMSLHIDQKENLWIGTRENGLSIVPIIDLEEKGGKAIGVMYAPTQFEGSLTNRCINTIFEDQNNNIWLGTYSGGLQWVSESRKKIHALQYIPGHPESPSHPKIWGITEAKDGNIWLGTDGGGIDVWNKKRGIIKRIKHTSSGGGLSDNAILSALTDQKGFLWFGTYRGGVNRINPATEAIKIYPKVPTATPGEYVSDIRCIFQDSSGKIWIGTNWKGICILDEQTDSFVNIPEFGNIDVRAITESSSGRYWIGSLSRGLFLYDPQTRKVKNYRHTADDENSLPSDDIYSLLKDVSGRLWIGTQYGGLSCFDPQTEKFSTFNSRQGLMNNTVLSILEDSKGYLWLSTNEGISRFDTSTNRFINYDYTNGVVQGEFQNGSAIAASDGTFYFGGSNGLNYFDPRFIQPSGITPKVVFTELKIFNETVSPGSGIIDENIEFTPPIRLNHKQSVFTINFQALQYPKAGKCQYSYKLEGYDEKWNLPGTNGSATYRQLPAGHYKLLVKASNADGVWSPYIASINIESIPPFWKTIWAYFLYTLALVLLVRFLFIFRMKQIRVQNQLQFEQKIRQKEQKIHNERLKFFTNISHELRTPLTLVECAVDDLKNLLARTRNIKVKEALDTASYHSSRLLELINQLLEFRRIETGTPQIQVEKLNLNAWMSSYLANFKELADSKSISLKMSMPVKTLELWADPDKLSMIINNLISNAFKYTKEKGTIEVLTAENENEIIITISDSGVGISPKALPFIFDRYFKTESESTSSGIGLSLTKSLVELHQGHIKVESTPGKGSSLTVQFLKGNTHFKPDLIKTTSTDHSYTNEISEVIELKPTLNGSENKIMLIIEDNSDLSTVLANRFSNSFEVHVAENGEKGITLAKSIVPDIIISDIMMPGIQGTEVCRELKQDAQTSHIPIILLTAKGTIDDELIGLNTGADDYISKPFNFQILVARVNTLLQNRIKLNNYFSEKSMITEPKENTAKEENAEHEFLQKVEELIREKYLNSDSSVFQLAEDLNFSRSSLYRKIKMLTGLSINEFVRSVKIKKAAELITQKNITISEAAYQVGFNDLKYFRETFTKQIGATPSEFKKKSKK